MENFNWLLQGFAEAATPMNLLYAVIGVLLGTAVGVLPGIGPAMTVALLLPITYNVSPSAAFIMFAGIFYGGMYGGSTTSILLNTPGESSSVITAIEGNKMAKAGRAAQALATAAIGSFVAGTIGTLLLAAFAPAISRFAVTLGAPSYLAIMLFALVAVTAVLGSSKLRGAISLVLGLAIGMVGIDFLTGQARATFGIPQLSDGIDIVVIAVAIFALGEALWVAAHLRQRPADVIPVGRPWMGRERLEAVVEAVAARHRVRLPVRRAARRRRGAADVPVLHHGEEALEAPRGVRQGRHRGRRGTGGRQQRFGRRHSGADAVAGAADQRHRGGDADRVRLLRNPAGPNAVLQGAAADLDVDRQPVHRQLPAAGAQPSAGAAVGEAAAHPAAVPVRGHPVLRHARRVRGQHPAAGPGAAADLRAAGIDDAALRASGAAVDHRGHPGAAHRTSAAAEPAAGRRRLGQPVHRARGDRRVRLHGPAAAGAAGAQADAPRRGDAAARRGRQGPAREGPGS